MATTPKTPKKRGRPKKYTKKDQMKKIIDEYFKECDEANKPYTISGLAYALDMDRKSILNYSKDEEFFHTIKKAKLKIEQQLEENLYRLGNNSGIIFNLKNNYGWIDKTETVQEKQEMPEMKITVIDNSKLEQALYDADTK